MARRARRTYKEAVESVKPVVAEQVLEWQTAIYARLSIENSGKDDKGESIEGQIEICKEYVEEHPYLHLADVYTDNGWTGTNTNRPEFQRLLNDINDGKIKALVIKDFSRFSRDYIESGNLLENVFPFMGVRFISVADNYDSFETDGSAESLLIPLKNLINSYYSKDISKKVSTAIHTKQLAGEHIPSMIPYEYMKSETREYRFEPDPETAPIVRRIYDMALEGKIVSEIATVLNREKIETPAQYFRRKFPNIKKHRMVSKGNSWDSSNIRRIIQHKIYTGAVISQTRQWKNINVQHTYMRDESEWIIVPNYHEAIVHNVEYEKAQLVIRKIEAYERGEKDYMLRSLIRCGMCGRAMSRNPRGKEVTYYCDKSRFVEDTDCPVGERFKENELEKVISEIFICLLNLIIDHDKELKKAVSKTKGTEANLKQSILRLEKSIKQNSQAKVTAYERYSDGVISRNEFIAIRDQLAMELTKCNDEKSKLEKQLTEMQSAVDSEMNQLTTTAYEFLNAEQITNHMLLFFIDRIYMYSGTRIEIKYKFKDTLKDILEP